MMRGMQRFNLFHGDLEPGDDRPEGFRRGAGRIGEAIGAERLAGRVYLLPPGEAVCPYHYEYGVEEWLLVLSGHPVVRHPGGEETLDPGDVVCFAEGPDGAHQVKAGGGETRVAIVSNRAVPNVAVYPDSDKVGVFDIGADELMAPRSSGVDYWDGER
jgi:uncharacterized cupin superfamily protein